METQLGLVGGQEGNSDKIAPLLKHAYSLAIQNMGQDDVFKKNGSTDLTTLFKLK
jgi:hypothetical protein